MTVSELCEAATKIQASFRGHLVRKSAPRKDEEEELSKELEKLDAKVGINILLSFFFSSAA